MMQMQNGCITANMIHKSPWKNNSKKVKFMLDKKASIVYYMQVGKS